MATQPGFGCPCCRARREDQCVCDFASLRRRCRECNSCAACCPADCDGRRVVCNVCDSVFTEPLPICSAPFCRAAVCRMCRDDAGRCEDCVREAATIARAEIAELMEIAMPLCSRGTGMRADECPCIDIDSIGGNPPAAGPEGATTSPVAGRVTPPSARPFNAED